MATLRNLVRGATHLLAPLTANCRVFHRNWERASGLPSPGGRWAGEWKSLSTGHSGPLRCVLEVENERLWRLTFHAGYARIFRACYCTSMTVARVEDRWTFTGRSDLGRLAGGVYEHEGEATSERFHSRYRCSAEHGEFNMIREG